MATLRSGIAHLAMMIRCAGTAYIIAQVLLWHSFYTTAPWRLTAPVLAVAWALAVMYWLRGLRLSPALGCADFAVYVALALAAQSCVPSAVRDDAFSWLVIAISGQLIVPAWYGPARLSAVLPLLSPLAYCAGAMLQPVADARTVIRAAALLLLVGLVHAYGRRALYRRAAVADAGLEQADRASGEQYALLRATVERREHERLVHDTVLNTLTALARGTGGGPAEAVSRCRSDMDLIEAALGGADIQGWPGPGSLPARLRAVLAGLSDRGLNVRLDDAGAEAAAVPERVAAALAGAVREALSNVAAHAGTGQAWVRVRAEPAGQAGVPCRIAVTVRDEGAGFDVGRVDGTRLGLKRSIAERVADCGGRASVWSEPGRGTEVSLLWPAALWPAPGPADEPVPAGYSLADSGLG
jgi:signal transduction histidine kinase